MAERGNEIGHFGIGMHIQSSDVSLSQPFWGILATHVYQALSKWPKMVVKESRLSVNSLTGAKMASFSTLEMGHFAARDYHVVSSPWSTYNTKRAHFHCSKKKMGYFLAIWDYVIVPTDKMAHFDWPKMNKPFWHQSENSQTWLCHNNFGPFWQRLVHEGRQNAPKWLWQRYVSCMNIHTDAKMPHFFSPFSHFGAFWQRLVRDDL